MFKTTSRIASTLAASTVIAVTLGCGGGIGSDTETPLAGPMPQHHFIPSDAPPPHEVVCSLQALTGPLSEIWRRPAMPCTLDEGWASPERNGSWVQQEHATVVVHLQSAQWDRVAVDAAAYSGLSPDVEQVMTVSINGHPVGRTAVERSWRMYEFSVEPGVLNAGANTVMLSFAHRASPSESGKGKDRRLLAAMIRSVAITAKKHAWGVPQGAEAATVFDAGAGRFVIDRPGTLVLTPRVTEGSDRIDLEFFASPTTDWGSSQVTVNLITLDGGWERTIELTGAGAPASRQPSVRSSIPLDWVGTGEPVLMNIEVDPRPAGSSISVAPPVAAGNGASDGAPETVETSTRTEPRDLPDIVLITLDALRADHVTSYGYHRPTTPFIDEIAATSLVFTDAHALAPYTLNSVATMITGLSFLDHGVRTREDVLTDEAVTLAEYLKVAGYTTVAFSRTPNNSIAKGFHQGYDEFHELWRGAKRRSDRTPHLTTEAVVDWLEQNQSTAPLHLQVHYVPPHAPYEPDPSFDVFTDPDYDGPCDGYPKTLMAIESGRIPRDDGCLTHVINRYDDNLLAVDDAVGRLLDALKARSRWSDTVVLITSDHGEAFLEHGRMDHNSTVFDEMLRVPFVLRLPSRVDASAAVTDRLVTLADIVPTLCAVAGIRPLMPLDGLDLLETDLAPANIDSRFFISTTTSRMPLHGLRTKRWKAIMTAAGHGFQFDLDRDPAEMKNTVFDDPARFAGLGMLLTERLEMPAVVAPSVDTADITEEDRSMLEALGYLE